MDLCFRVNFETDFRGCFLIIRNSTHFGERLTCHYPSFNHYHSPSCYNYNCFESVRCSLCSGDLVGYRCYFHSSLCSCLELQILVTCFDYYYSSYCFSDYSIIMVAYEGHQLVLGHEQHLLLGCLSFEYLPQQLVSQRVRAELAVLCEVRTGLRQDWQPDFDCKGSSKNQHFPVEQSLRFSGLLHRVEIHRSDSVGLVIQVMMNC